MEYTQDGVLHRVRSTTQHTQPRDHRMRNERLYRSSTWTDTMTMHEAFTQLGEAWHDFVLELAYSLKIDKLCEWLTRRLQ